jgi:hypothetical protein
MYPYGAENPQGSFGFPLSGVGEVPKFVGVGSVVWALAPCGVKRQTPTASPLAVMSLKEVQYMARVISGLLGKSNFAS